MRSKLITVADDLAVPIEEAARADAADADLADTGDEADDDRRAPVDPRYEDLWVNEEESLEIPDLAALDLDLEEREE
jgi:hypothetical protein